MNLLLIAPILIPLTTASLAAIAWNYRGVQRGLGVVGAAGLLASSMGLLWNVSEQGILSVQIGNWPAPFGITLVADLFSAIMVVLAGLAGFSVTIYSLRTMDAARESFGYYLLLNLLLAGVCGAFLTGDIFNLYVWFEVMLIASFILLALGGERPQMEGSIKYVTLNMLSSGFFLAAIGILYGLVGSLNMAHVAVRLESPDVAHVRILLAMLFLIAFGIKAAVFPLFFWLPASYHTPPVAVSAVFAGLLTKVGVYALIRFFTLIFVHDVDYTHTIILAIAGLTMITGVLGAVAQNEIRRILSFHIVSQIGYMVMGLGLFSPLALAGSIFYISHHIIVKTCLFLVGGLVQQDSGTGDLKKLGGFYIGRPGLAVVFLISALSLAGLPPLSGFFAKLVLVRAGLIEAEYWIVATALAVSLLTLFSMMKIWNEVFWKPRPAGQEQGVVPVPGRGVEWLGTFPGIFLATLTVLIGLSADRVFNLAMRAAEQLVDPTIYIRAILGG